MECEKCGGTGKKPDPQKLLRARVKTGLNQKQVAKRMGISFQYLSDLENGRRDWNGKLLIKFKEKVLGK